MTVIHCMECMSPGCIGCSSAEPTTAEAFEAMRGALSSFRGLIEVYYSDNKESDGSIERGVAEAADALALLERRMQDSPSLAVLVESFCLEVENAKFSRDARKSGGQTTGTVSPFEHVQPSVAMALERWARDFRDALKR